MADELTTLAPKQRLARLLKEKRRRRAGVSLASFIRQAWPILEPETPLIWNWHIDALCEELEAISDGMDRKLPAPEDPIRDVINMPPRYLKSTIVTIMWPVWEWGPRGMPWTRWIFGSYSAGLSTKHSVDRRTIIESTWYQENWGHVFRLSTDQNVKTEFSNNYRGVMLATSIGGGQLGRGGHRVVIDDPHNTKNYLSDDQRETDVRIFKQGYSTRLDDKQRGAIVIVMQRLHEQDLSAHCLALGYRHLKLENPCAEDTTLVTRRGTRYDRKAGELLSPEREGLKDIATMRVTLGPFAFAGQYSQTPSPAGGVIFQRDWWEEYRELPANLDSVAISIDCAFKALEDSDFVCAMVGGWKGANCYLIERTMERLTFGGTKALIKQLHARYPKAAAIYVEDKANGPAVIDDLKDAIPGLIAVDPQGGKIARAHSVSGTVEAGNVYLPQYLDEFGNVIPGRDWVAEFIDKAAKFPKVANDDDIDAFTQLVIARRNRTTAILDLMRQEAEALARANGAVVEPAPSSTVVSGSPPAPAKPAITVEDAKRLFG